MYICTFYSFKGGVGRSLALVNVAAHFAQCGKRVLLVDFDLEAPGLDTFDLLQPNTNTPGLVEYVQKYLKENRVSNICDHIAQSSISDRLYLLPSGAAKRSYAYNAFQIDWKDLYANRDGYLLFEDMKGQWEQQIQPDYVFIDSRTGYSDTSGICTRHLPDAVVILFFPNDQNLRGISKVVEGIRGEAKTMREKHIELHFVMSNVPFLDDEDEIILDFRNRFSEELQFNDCHVIHRYDSLPLLQQSVFITTRPKSRLAKEYQQLAERISGANIEDRNGALLRLDEYWERLNNPSSDNDRVVAKRRVTEETKTLNQIEAKFPRDFEILFKLARLWAKGGDLPGSDMHPSSLISDALEVAPSDHHSAEMLVTVAEDSLPEYQATEFALDALDYPTTLQTLKRAIDCLRGELWFFEVDITEKIASSAAISSMSIEDQFKLAVYLERCNFLDYSDAILFNIVENDVSGDKPADALSLLTRNQIAEGQFETALELLLRKYSAVQEMSLIDAFNFGIATWGKQGSPNSEPFVYVRDQVDEQQAMIQENLPMDALDDIQFSTNPIQDFGEGGFDRNNRIAVWDFDGQDTEGLRRFEEYELAQMYLFCCWMLNEVGNSHVLWDMRIGEFGLSNSKRLFSYWQYEYVFFSEFRNESLNLVDAPTGQLTAITKPPCINRHQSVVNAN